MKGIGWGLYEGCDGCVGDGSVRAGGCCPRMESEHGPRVACASWVEGEEYGCGTQRGVDGMWNAEGPVLRGE